MITLKIGDKIAKLLYGSAIDIGIVAQTNNRFAFVNFSKSKKETKLRIESEEEDSFILSGSYYSRVLKYKIATKEMESRFHLIRIKNIDWDSIDDSIIVNVLNLLK
jgi:hypothetical protein